MGVFRSGRRYDVLLCVRAEALPEDPAKLVLIYGGRPLPFDVESGVDFQQRQTRMRCLITGPGFRYMETASPSVKAPEGRLTKSSATRQYFPAARRNRF